MAKNDSVFVAVSTTGNILRPFFCPCVTSWYPVQCEDMFVSQISVPGSPGFFETSILLTLAHWRTHLVRASN